MERCIGECNRELIDVTVAIPRISLDKELYSFLTGVATSNLASPIANPKIKKTISNHTRPPLSFPELCKTFQLLNRWYLQFRGMICSNFAPGDLYYWYLKYLEYVGARSARVSVFTKLLSVSLCILVFRTVRWILQWQWAFALCLVPASLAQKRLCPPGFFKSSTPLWFLTGKWCSVTIKYYIFCDLEKKVSWVAIVSIFLVVAKPAWLRRMLSRNIW